MNDHLNKYRDIIIRVDDLVDYLMVKAFRGESRNAFLFNAADLLYKT